MQHCFVCFLFKEGLASGKAAGRENKHTKWWKLVFKNILHQLSVHSYERSVQQPISSMLSVTGSSSTPTSLAGIGSSGKLVVSGRSCCFDLTGWLEWLLLSVTAHPVHSTGKSHSSSEWRFWELNWQDPGLPGIASRTGEPWFPSAVPAEALESFSAPSRRLGWS